MFKKRAMFEINRAIIFFKFNQIIENSIIFWKSFRYSSQFCILFIISIII